MAYTLEQRINLVRGATHGINVEAAVIIAQMCQDADARGSNASVWHNAAQFFGSACDCVACNPRAPKGRFAYHDLRDPRAARR